MLDFAHALRGRGLFRQSLGPWRATQVSSGTAETQHCSATPAPTAVDSRPRQLGFIVRNAYVEDQPAIPDDIGTLLPLHRQNPGLDVSCARESARQCLLRSGVPQGLTIGAVVPADPLQSTADGRWPHRSLSGASQSRVWEGSERATPTPRSEQGSARARRGQSRARVRGPISTAPASASAASWAS